MGSVLHRLFSKETPAASVSAPVEVPVSQPEPAPSRADPPADERISAEASITPKKSKPDSPSASESRPAAEPVESPAPKDQPSFPPPSFTPEIPVPGPRTINSSSLNLIDSPRVDPEEWRLEEALADHHEWLETRGVSGKKADFAAAQLADTELISVDLRYADLQEANLRSADLLLADLRGACLARAQLDDACLVGANLEGANLESASLSTAMGLLPRQLAGADLYKAALPANLSEFNALPEFLKSAQMAARYFTVTLVYSLLSCLFIWKTRDSQLLTDSAVIPFLHATAAVPTAEFYLISPAVLLILYLVFHFYLQQAWENLMELPAVFPDGRELGASGPRVVQALARTHFYWLSPQSPSVRFIEKWAVRIAAYWLAPFTLLLYWGRYLTLQQIHGTLLHVAFVVGSAGVALHSTLRIGRRAERWVIHPAREFPLLARLRATPLAYSLTALGAFLVFLSVGVMIGVPHDPARAPQYGSANFRRWAPDLLWIAGVDPYANLTEASLSVKPPDWSGDDSQLTRVKGPHLSQANLRYAEAYGAFLPNAHLWRADLEGVYFSLADLCGSDLSQANLRFAILDSARLTQANLDHADLDGVTAARADFRNANLSYVAFENASLVDALFDSASLYTAHLDHASLIRAHLEKTDLRDADLTAADLSHADLEQAYLWSAKLAAANLNGAKLQSAILIDADLSGADLRSATFQGTVLNDANLSGALLDGADLRGAFGIGATQICSVKSRSGMLVDDWLAQSVTAQCGGPLPQTSPAESLIPTAPAAGTAASASAAKAAPAPTSSTPSARPVSAPRPAQSSLAVAPAHSATSASKPHTKPGVPTSAPPAAKP